ncbi:hypothetical protein D3C77_583970 [compost metagenome]
MGDPGVACHQLKKFGHLILIEHASKLPLNPLLRIEVRLVDGLGSPRFKVIGQIKKIG